MLSFNIFIFSFFITSFCFIFYPKNTKYFDVVLNFIKANIIFKAFFMIYALEIFFENYFISVAVFMIYAFLYFKIIKYIDFLYLRYINLYDKNINLYLTEQLNTKSINIIDYKIKKNCFDTKLELIKNIEDLKVYFKFDMLINICLCYLFLQFCLISILNLILIFLILRKLNPLKNNKKS